MTSIALGVFIVFIVYVMIWSMRNDGAKSLRDQRGFIRMRVPKGAGPADQEGAAAERTGAKGNGRGHHAPSSRPAGVVSAGTAPLNAAGRPADHTEIDRR
jgi:hypothetical protein